MPAIDWALKVYRHGLQLRKTSTEARYIYNFLHGSAVCQNKGAVNRHFSDVQTLSECPEIVWSVKGKAQATPFYLSLQFWEEILKTSKLA